MKLTTIDNFFQGVSDLRVLVIGETITDRFQRVNYEGHSMKSFCPVFRVEDDAISEQQGGAMAVANHLKGFVKQVDIETNGDDHRIVKTRLIDANSSDKHVEINRFPDFSNHQLDVRGRDYDVVIVADFGHGYCDNLLVDDGFHLMCQTNSNNFGFNRLSKWKNSHKRSICIDLREASLQLNKKISSMDEETIKGLFNYETNTEEIYVTLGAAGSSFYNGSQFIKTPSFKSQIVDTIGAGDTFFAFACIASAIDMNPEQRMLVPALAASLSTTWLCNEKSVEPEALLKYATQFI
ncbi:hypothetical protein KFE98_00815 [bacterium SCSIO 12741]|nr:hypothetical protein KFE98_00815 [bacterium SCSIO 12741]